MWSPAQIESYPSSSARTATSRKRPGSGTPSTSWPLPWIPKATSLTASGARRARSTDAGTQVRVHLAARRVRVARLDRRGDRPVVLVDRAVEARAELRPGEVSLQDGEDGLRGDRQQRVAGTLDHREVEVLVVDELPLRAEAERLIGDRVPEPR